MSTFTLIYRLHGGKNPGAVEYIPGPRISNFSEKELSAQKEEIKKEALEALKRRLEHHPKDFAVTAMIVDKNNRPHWRGSAIKAMLVDDVLKLSADEAEKYFVPAGLKTAVRDARRFFRREKNKLMRQ